MVRGSLSGWVVPIILALAGLLIFLAGGAIRGCGYTYGHDRGLIMGGGIIRTIGAVLFLGAVLSHRRIAGSILRAGKYVWAKYRWVGLAFATVTLVAVVALVVMQAQHRATLRVLHYDGHTWSPMESGPTEWLADVWGSSASDVFAVGDSGTIVHYDGNAWSPMESDTTGVGLTGVWGSSASDVFVVGH